MRPGHRPAPSTLRRFGSTLPSGHSIVLPAFHQAVRNAGTVFPSRVFAPDELPRILKSGHHSRKIGAKVTKGKLRGWPIYTLTLEERASCPRSYREWQSCYGNGMQAAERVQHGQPLIEMLAVELAELACAHAGGFMVRLHVLGDFWSTAYVAFWSRMLRDLPMLVVFGFTAHPPSSEIGRALSDLQAEHGWSRAAIRFSGSPQAIGAARVIEPGETDADAILCPAQTGATDCCATCALCWSSPRSIAFKRH